MVDIKNKNITTPGPTSYIKAILTRLVILLAFSACKVDFTHDFSGSRTYPGYILEYGRQEASANGWRMYRTANSDSRMRLNMLLDQQHILVTGRLRSAANDSGRDSNLYLIDQACSDGVQNFQCDEIDIVEAYGGEKPEKAEWTIWKNGVHIGNGAYPLPGHPGYNFYTYQVYLDKGNYLKLSVNDLDGHLLGSKELRTNVPSHPMYLYTGIWDCSTHADWCGPTFNGESYMELQTLSVRAW